MLHLPQFAKSLKQELRGSLLVPLGVKDGPLRWDRSTRRAHQWGWAMSRCCLLGKNKGSVCPVLAKTLPSLASSSPCLPLLQPQRKSALVPSNAGAGKVAGPTQPGPDAPLPGACLGYTSQFISSTAAEKMFQGVRKFPELELVKLMY